MHKRAPATALGTVAAAIFASGRLDGELTAFMDRDGATISYAAALAATDQIISALTELGIDAGDRVAFMVPRGPWGLIGFLAISSVAVCCPLNPKVTPGELESTIEALQITAVVDIDTSAVVESIAVGNGLLTLSLMPGGGDALDLALSGKRARSSGRPVESGAPRLAMMMRTSGTTSKPKLVGLTHENILSAAGVIGKAFALGNADLCLNPMPLHHVHGLISAGISSLLAGSKMICPDGFSPATFEDIFAQCRPTWFTASPAMHMALLEHFNVAGRTPAPGMRFFRSSSAPLAASAIGRLEALFDAPLIETYGLTETASMICSNPLPPATRKLGSVGIAFGAEIRIGDESGADLPANQNGEILVRGPSVIQRYRASDKPHGDAFFGDWLRTGDVGHLDQDGYLFIVGRTKELIKRGGLSVYPSEVDNALTSHPDVAEAVAFSVPHPTIGEELVAAVVPRAGTSPAERELRNFVAGRLSTYKVPTSIIVIDSIPRNETGKVVRGDLPAKLARHLQPSRRAPETAAEIALFDAWVSVIGRDDFGVTDNVFVLGADPLRAARVAELLKSKFGHAPSARQLISNPRIRDQAVLISAKPETRSDVA
jgi:acyl-CoA synthetase (AMP-forming)/AMP-acid ligase II